MSLSGFFRLPNLSSCSSCCVECLSLVSSEAFNLLFSIFVCMLCVLVSQLCPTLCDPMDCSSVHGIFQARVLEWVAISFSRASSQPGIEPRSPALQADSLPTELQGKIFNIYFYLLIFIWLLQVLLWHAGSFIFIAACELFSSDRWDLVPQPGIESGPLH